MQRGVAPGGRPRGGLRHGARAWGSGSRMCHSCGKEGHYASHCPGAAAEGRGGETGACKDFVDLVRYMALGRLRYTGEGIVKTLGGGSY